MDMTRHEVQPTTTSSRHPVTDVGLLARLLGTCETLPRDGVAFAVGALIALVGAARDAA